MVVYRGKARYQRGHSAQYSGFKLANSTFVLSIHRDMGTLTILLTSIDINVALVPILVASSQLLARLCYLYLSSSLHPHPISIALLPLPLGFQMDYPCRAPFLGADQKERGLWNKINLTSFIKPFYRK